MAHVIRGAPSENREWWLEAECGEIILKCSSNKGSTGEWHVLSIKKNGSVVLCPGIDEDGCPTPLSLARHGQICIFSGVDVERLLNE